MEPVVFSTFKTKEAFQPKFNLKTNNPITVPLRADLSEKEYAENEERITKAHLEYQNLLNKAKKNGVPVDEVKRFYSEEGIPLSKIKIEPYKLTVSEKDSDLTICYDKKGREVKLTRTGDFKASNYFGKPIDCVKREEVVVYHDNGRKVTLKNENDKYSGKLTETSTITTYAKDKNGKPYKYQVLKFIGINDEPNVSEINFYAPDGTKSPESIKAWQMQ